MSEVISLLELLGRGRDGLIIALLALVIFMIWRLGSNHFRHLSGDMQEMKGEVKAVRTEVGDLNQRVARVEGKLDNKE